VIAVTQVDLEHCDRPRDVAELASSAISRRSDQLLEDLDEDGEIVPTLAKAAKRVRRVTNA